MPLSDHTSNLVSLALREYSKLNSNSSFWKNFSKDLEDLSQVTDLGSNMPEDFLHRTAQMVSCSILTHSYNLKPSQFLEPVGQSLPATSISGSIRVAEWKKGTEVWPMAMWTSNVTGPATSGLLRSPSRSWMQQLGSGFTSQKLVVSVCHCPSWGQRHGLATERVSVQGQRPAPATLLEGLHEQWTNMWGPRFKNSFQDDDHRAFTQARGPSKCGSPCRALRSHMKRALASAPPGKVETAGSPIGVTRAGHSWQDSADSVFTHVGFFLLLGTACPFSGI